MPDSNRRRGWLIVAMMAVLAIIIVPLAANAFGSSPEDYLREHYDHVRGDNPDDTGGVVFHSDDDAETTAKAIADGSSADERREEGGIQYLRYDSDWMITVSDDASGSEITLYDFDQGYTSHAGAVVFWGTYFNRGSGGSGFRGGGSGSGK